MKKVLVCLVAEEDEHWLPYPVSYWEFTFQNECHWKDDLLIIHKRYVRDLDIQRTNSTLFGAIENIFPSKCRFDYSGIVPQKIEPDADGKLDTTKYDKIIVSFLG